MSKIKITVNSTPLQHELTRLAGVMDNPRSLMLDIAETLHAQSMSLFQNEGWPNGSWADLRPSTRRARARQGHWPGKKLQVSGRLAASIQTAAGNNYAQIGTNAAYAAIHQIHRTGSVQLRTAASGELVRQKSNANLAVFAKRGHKRKTARAVDYLINISARPFLPVTPDGQLIPPAVGAVNRVLVNKFVKK